MTSCVKVPVKLVHFLRVRSAIQFRYRYVLDLAKSLLFLFNLCLRFQN